METENIIETYIEENGCAWYDITYYSTFIERLMNTEDFEKYKLQKRRHENISKLLEME
jgi:translation elongation factor P/translation initiation factor 5A